MASHQPPQQYSDRCQYTDGKQTLGPPPINTDYTYSAHPMNRVPNDGSSYSSYATRAPSIAASDNSTQRSYDTEVVNGAPGPTYSLMNFLEPEDYADTRGLRRVTDFPLRSYPPARF